MEKLNAATDGINHLETEFEVCGFMDVGFSFKKKDHAGTVNDNEDKFNDKEKVGFSAADPRIKMGLLLKGL